MRRKGTWTYLNATDVYHDFLAQIGAKTLEALGFKHDVTVIGVDDHFEIWDAAKWEAENAGLEDELFELMFGGSN